MFDSKGKSLKIQRLCFFATPIALFLTSATARAETIVKVDGSSTVFPVTEAVAEEFQKEKKGAINVAVGISGTGGGFKKFCRGETDVQNASRPILKEEMEVCKANGVTYYELPIAFDAMAIVTSTKNSWLDSITVEELKKIWEPSAQGKVMTWKQVNGKWPDQPLTLFGAGSDSGTFDYFTEAIVGKAKSSRGDYTGSEDDNTLVQGISSNPNSLGYIPYAYYEPNKKKLKLIAVDGGAKAPKKGAIKASAETVRDGSYFPLSRPIFIYVSGKQASRPEVKAFTEFYLKNAAELSSQVKYVPLPNDAYSQALARFQKGQLGTGFGGVPEVGLHIDELLKRNPVM